MTRLGGWACGGAALLAGIAACAGRTGTATLPTDPGVDEPPIHTRIDLPSIAACGPCHQDVFEQWSLSLHHGAWTNANVRQATDDFRKEECRACHSPMPVLATGLDRRPDFPRLQPPRRRALPVVPRAPRRRRRDANASRTRRAGRSANPASRRPSSAIRAMSRRTRRFSRVSHSLKAASLPGSGAWTATCPKRDEAGIGARTAPTAA